MGRDLIFFIKLPSISTERVNILSPIHILLIEHVQRHICGCFKDNLPFTGTGDLLSLVFNSSGSCFLQTNSITGSPDSMMRSVFSKIVKKKSTMKFVNKLAAGFHKTTNRGLTDILIMFMIIS